MTIYQHDNASAFRFRLIGRLEQQFVCELELCWKSAASILRGRPVRVDVHALEGWDELGARLLRRMHADGVTFDGAPLQTRVFTSLGIPLNTPSARGNRSSPFCVLRRLTARR